MGIGPEIDEGRDYIGYSHALELVRSYIHPLDVEYVSLEVAAGRILAEDLRAIVDSPSLDVSLKDGYAVSLECLQRTDPGKTVELKVTGTAHAGDMEILSVTPGCAVKVTTGAPLPQGTDAVIAAELCNEQDNRLFFSEAVYPGQNILRAGTDVSTGEPIGTKGEWLSPGKLGFFAAAGLHQIRVYRMPRVSILATGDEVAPPGAALRPGQVYASNLVTLASWLHSFGVRPSFQVVPDSRDRIETNIWTLHSGTEQLLISGGAWGSERDLVVDILSTSGWKKVFHRVRMGPGKAVAFGLLEQKPIFCLPGGPPSNEMAFLQLALPAVLWQAGWKGMPFRTVLARIDADLVGRRIDWTQFIHARLTQDGQGTLWATPHRTESRLQSMALTECLIPIPEGTEGYTRGQVVEVQVLSSRIAFGVQHFPESDL